MGDDPDKPIFSAELNKLELNTKLPKNTFVYTPPDSIEVEDLTELAIKRLEQIKKGKKPESGSDKFFKEQNEVFKEMIKTFNKPTEEKLGLEFLKKIFRNYLVSRLKKHPNNLFQIQRSPLANIFAHPQRPRSTTTIFI